MTRFVPITEHDDDERPSKTALKKQAHEQQALGEALAALSDARLAAIDMPESLRDALHEYQRTRSHEGRRRPHPRGGNQPQLLRPHRPGQRRDTGSAEG